MFNNYFRPHQIKVIFFLLFFLISCTASQPQWQHNNENALRNHNNLNLNTYLVDSGDELEIKFFYYPELNERIFVRPDGKIKLQLIPEIAVAGLSVKELNNKLVDLYSKHIKQPEISVIMRGFSGQRIFVGGEVNNPQVISLVGKMDVLQAILQVGGFNNTACKKSVIVISRDSTNTPFGRVLNIDGLINGKKGVTNIFLNPYDIIVVPKTQIAQMNLFVRQYIRDILPVATSFQGAYTFTTLK